MAIFLKLVILTLSIQMIHIADSKKQSNTSSTRSKTNTAIMRTSSPYPKTIAVGTTKTTIQITTKNTHSVQVHTSSATSSVKTTSQAPPPQVPNCKDLQYSSSNNSINVNLNQKTTSMITGFDFLLYNTEGKTVKNVTNNTIFKVTDLPAGTNFSLDLTAVGIDKRSSDSCTKQVFTRPADPNCLNVIYYAENESISMNLSQILMNGVHGYDVIVFGEDNKTAPYNGTNIIYVLLKHLDPGREFKIVVKAIGGGNLRSGACTRSVFTKPADPNCDYVIYKSENESISMNFSQILTGNVHGYDVILYEESDEVLAYNKTDITDVIFKNLEPGRQFKVEATAVGRGKLRSGSCTKNVYTRPPDPKCEEVIYTSENSSISMNLIQILTDGVHGFNVVIVDKNNLIDTILYNKTEITNVNLDQLKPGGEYQVQINAIGRGNLSSGTCTRKVYTRPSDPNCEEFIYESESNSITLNLTQFLVDGVHGYNVVLIDGRNKLILFNRTNIIDTEFENLQPGREFQVKVQAVGRGSLRSDSCTRRVFTRPAGPSNCEQFSVDKVNAKQINLTLPFNGTFDYLLTVGGKQTLIPKTKTFYNLEDLNADFPYNITLQQILQSEDGLNLTSTERCFIKNYWTRPFLNCSKIIWQHWHQGWQVSLPRNSTYQYAVYTSYDEFGKNSSFKKTYEEFLAFDFATERGTSYTLEVYFIGHGPEGLISEPKCHKTNALRPILPPVCSNAIVKQDATRIVLDPFKLLTNGTGARFFRLQMRPIISESLGDLENQSFTEPTISYQNLPPGSKYTFEFKSIGKAGAVSSYPCTVIGYTRPTDPNCSILTYSARNDVIQTDLRGNISYGAQSYNIVVMHGSSIIQNASSVIHLKLMGLLAGESYNLIVTAVGLKNMQSRNSCHKTVCTRPNKPLCDSLIINNFTTSSAAWTSMEPSPVGATIYNVLLKAGSEKEMNKTLGLTDSISFSNLQPGYQYQSVIFSVSKYGMISEENCTYSFYTEPSAVETVNISLSATSFCAKWDKPVGTVEFYFVDTKCQCSSACTFQSRNHTIKKTQIDIAGLVPGTTCNLTIVAYSGNMKSIPKNVYSIYTNETVPDVVQNVTIHRNSSHIQVFWEQPSKPNGIIQSYTVYLFDTNNNRPIVKHSNPSTTAGFESLIPGTCYTVKVTASNNAGEGIPVSFNVYTDEEEPGQVEQISGSNISSTTISISWTKPDRPNGIIIKYSIQILEAGKCIQLVLLNCRKCKNTCSNDKEKEVKESVMNIETGKSLGCRFQTTLDFNQTETVFRQNVTNLSPFTNYSVSVYASTSKGKGDVSQIYQYTSEDHPGQVVNMSLASEFKAVKVSFKPPSNPNGIILQYEIKYVPIETEHKLCYSDDKYSGEYNGITNGSSTFNITEEQNGKELVFTIDNLHSYWTYNISVRAKTSVGFGNFCDFVSERTKPDKPGPIRALSFTDVTNQNIALSWKEPCFTNGIISQYTVFVLSGNSTKTSLNSTGRSIVIPQLLPYTNYNMTVFGVTSGESGGIGLQGVSTGMKRTLCEEPKEPTNLTIVSTTSKSIAVRWKQPVMKTCDTDYEVNATDASNSSIIKNCTTIGFNNVTCNITGLDEYWNYTLTLTAFTTYRNSSRSWNGTLLSRTCQAPPGNVTDVTIETEKNVTKPRTITVKWRPPKLRDRNGRIKSFTIVYSRTNSATKMENVSFNSIQSTYELTIKDILPGNYDIRVFARTIYDANKENYVNRTNIELSPGAPLLLKISKGPLIQEASQVTVSNDEKQFPLSISKDILCDDTYGSIIERGVIVSDASQIGGSDQLFRGTMSEFKKRKTSIYRTWQSVHDMDNMPPYIATDDLKVTCSSGRTKRSASSSPSYNYVIGSDGECESGQKYCNGYLKPGKSYKARVYVCTAGGCTETQYLSQFTTEPNLVPVIAGGATGGIVAAAVVIIIVIIVIRIRRKRAKDGESTGDGETNFGFDGEMKNLKKGSKTSIQKSQFARKVEDLHADSNLIFAKEYKVIKENSPSHATEAAEQQSTRNKNRYTNILAYDHSRVKLLPTEDEEGSDYINANYIPGFNSQREYIATQGPQNCTKDDFWRMIWEQNVNVIVMLTQLIERGRRKCDQYWPNNTREPVFFGDLIVEMESESPMNDYILRVFSLKLGKNVKNVKHFQFLAWPDMGIPQTTECMLYFVRGVRDHTPAQRRGPIVVHCSAGVGRTGTFIAVDHLMQHVRTHDHLDIFNLVLTMRDNRTNMVQTEDQYIFIHDCIKDYIEELEHEDEDAEDGNVIEEPAYANAAIYANRS